LGGEGAADRDDLVGEAHVALRGNVSSSSDEDGGLSHQRAMITHDAPLPGMPIVVGSISLQ
jgi:hypothetical protein